MTATATSTDILGEIRGGPHWKVVIRPQSFEQERIATLGDCLIAVKDSRVWLGGRSYPGLDREDRGEDWVAAWAESRGRSEYWRLFQSGQFVHYFTFREDMPSWRTEDDRKYGKRSPEPNGYLDVGNLLYTCTEIFEFTACLMAAGILGPPDESPVVRIGMEHVRNRTLCAAFPWVLPDFRHAITDCLEHSRRVVGPGVSDEAAKQAREATRWFLDRFGMTTTDVVLKPEQEKILRRRLSL